ncbi:tumor susceptibility gene 101 protein isoform X2 [Toxorhynchites rutilus septentrionalis]|uniref:tumor susceptibility gene 101 protein isoform X2 n=1 Tax=Toxorhynchites rutilus septentrionalis TaxID=329112 RepID=UPI00247A42D8|nr:tumor susceptibility gene 101 protein isoform X2 [Toxorhynchites rutilus septentrionalis]
MSKMEEISRMLGNYIDPTATKKDVIECLKRYKALTYRYEEYVFNDGTIKQLLNLQGTIPVRYKGNTYHIPICIWLLDTHPKYAPICYVKPTSDMNIKVSIYVDQNGKIYLPYLHDWHDGRSDLLGLIKVMITTFGEFPPVYAKPKEQTPAYPTQTFMPQPPTSGQSKYCPYPTQQQQQFPPYPPAPLSYSGYGQPGAGSSYPPYMPPGMPTTSGYNAGYNPSSGQGTGTITEEHIKASLVSAVEDKLKRRIQEKVNQCQAEIQTLKRTAQELNEGQTKINDILSRLERDEQEMTKSISVLQDKEQELDRALEALEQADEIDVDEAVITTAPLYKQLLNAYAEEAAIEDAVYFMGEALRSGVIDLEVFLKHVRQLSRKQFMLRALMQKCRQKAGLPA